MMMGVRPRIWLSDIEAALARYPWLEEYRWHALRPDDDKYTAQAELFPHHGYFIRALPGARTEAPLQACLYLSTDGLAQNVHNIIIAEEGSELHIITGCTVGAHVRSGLHVGVSEFYIRKDEAAVGKIAPEEIEYLMARGLTQEEATAAIVRGFLDIEIKGLPKALSKEIKKAVQVEDVVGGF